MKKSLQILLGLVLILVLAYVSFLNISSKIKDDLLLKTKTLFAEKNVRGVSVSLKGEGLSMSRTLVLTGTAISEVERTRIVELAQGIEGVCDVNNQIIRHPAIPKVPTAIKIPLTKVMTNTKKEVLPVKNSNEESIVTKIPASVVALEKILITVPSVPVVEKKSIVVPTPVKAISVPKVIEVEKVKIEGVK